MDANFSVEGRVEIAVSQTSNPTGTWNVYAIDDSDLARAGCLCLGDQPLIGAHKSGFYVSTNEFPLAGPGLYGAWFNGAQIYAGTTCWGDYGAAQVAADGTIWLANEYNPGGTRTLYANWGTYVSHIQP